MSPDFTEKTLDRYFGADAKSVDRIAQTALTWHDDAPGSIATRIAPHLTTGSVEIAPEGIVEW
jgi:hypothetical protein